MTKDNSFMKEEKPQLPKALTWVGVAVGIIALSVLAFFITKAVTAPEPLAPQEEDWLVEDEYENEYEKLLSELSQPGEEIPEGSTGEATVGRNLETNRPMEGVVGLSSVREVDPMNIGPLKLEGPLMEEFDARFWYVTATVTVDEKPSDDTPIYFPVTLSNDQSPADDRGLVFPRENPDCMWGPETWGEVEGTSATMCRVRITFDSEPADKVFLIFAAMDFEAHPEYASNPPSLNFTATTLPETE